MIAPPTTRIESPMLNTAAAPATAEAAVKREEALTISQVSTVWIWGAVLLMATGAFFQSRALFGLGLVLAAAIGVSWLWARWSLRGLTFERRFSQSRAFWGEEVDMAQVFTNAKILPVPWLSVEDQVPGTLDIKSSSVVYSSQARRKSINTAISVGWYERVRRHYTVKCTTRGEHEFGPVNIRSGDIFGLFRRAETIDTPQPLLVYPRFVPVAQLGIPARQPFGDFKAAQMLATDPLRIRAVREYVTGDSPRHIHWKATARRGELQTKLFEPAATPQLFIFCNQDTFLHIWEGVDPDTLELTITVAASLANHALEEGYMVGLQVNAFAVSSDRQVKLPPSRDPYQLTRILESLARIRGWSGLPMEELIRAERRNIPRGSTIVIVTGVVTEDMLDILLALRRAGHPITLIEATGSLRAAEWAKRKSPEALQTQGIVYYQVSAIGKAAQVEQLSF
jgi:uncharacterized protein (DUF58 family)